jgi:hypothetical protein
VTLLDSYYPFDTPPGNIATPANWRRMARLWNQSGVVWGNQNNFNATISGGVVTIQPGAVFVDGFYGETTGNKTVGGVSSGLIVARLDTTQRQIYFVYLAGVNTPGQSPSSPTYDVPLYQVTSASAMTDVRQFLYTSTRPCANAGAATATGQTGDGAWFQIGYLTSNQWMKGGITFASGTFTVPAGVYQVEAAITYVLSGNAAAPAGRYVLGVRLNNTMLLQGEASTWGAAYPQPKVSGLIATQNGGTINMWGWKTNGGVAVYSLADYWMTWLSVAYVSPL